MNGVRLVTRCVVVAAVFATLTAGADTPLSILGHITADGKPLAGVRVDFGDNLPPILTDDAGYYESSGAVEGGVYLIEPAAAGWTFSPARRAVVMGSGDEQVNFVGEPVGGPLAGLLFAPPAAAARAKDESPYPDLLYPLGGETWTQGQVYNIRWSHDTTNLMRIFLRKNNSWNLYLTITNGTPNDGSFWWKVPAEVAAGSDYLILIDDGHFGDLSEHFTIQTAALVTYPSERHIAWRRGQGYQIKWQGFPGANVKIQLYRGSLLSRGIAWSTPNDGSFWWTVPADQRTADNYRIKVTAHKNGVNDMSDRPFAIVNNPRVTYPTYSGVVWDIGGSYNITWRQFVADQVKIDLIRCGTVDRVITAATANDGSFYWKVPYDLSPSGGGPVFKIRVRAVGNSGQSDKSNVEFQIRRVPAVTYPTANGIVWDAGSAYTIKWHGFASANVKIELLKGWALDRVIKGWTANDGSYKWWVPAGLTPGTNYRIRVRGTSGSTQQDTSDNNFTIAQAPLVLYPSAGGIVSGIGDTVEIRWQGFDCTSVRIYLERWGSFNYMISPGTPNDGSFNWTIPPGADTGNGFKVRVRAQPGLVSDESNQFFRINPAP